MWSRNYTGEAETFVMWSQGGVEICLFLLDQTARMDTKKVSTCQGSFGGFETTCFQLDQAASLDSTGMFYFSCHRAMSGIGCEEGETPFLVLEQLLAPNDRLLYRIAEKLR